MTLVVEDGTGLETANAYISVAYADDYHSLRSNTSWAAATTGAKESAIVRATEFLDAKYLARYRGVRSKALQALGWPRVNAIYEYRSLLYMVPIQVEQACAVIALRALTASDLYADSQNDSGLKRIKNKVGPIEEEIEYSGASSGPRESYSFAAGILAPILKPATLVRT